MHVSISVGKFEVKILTDRLILWKSCILNVWRELSLNALSVLLILPLTQYQTIDAERIVVTKEKVNKLLRKKNQNLGKGRIHIILRMVCIYFLENVCSSRQTSIFNKMLIKFHQFIVHKENQKFWLFINFCVHKMSSRDWQRFDSCMLSKYKL